MAAPMRYPGRPFFNFTYLLFMKRQLITFATALLFAATVSAKETKEQTPVDQWMLSHSVSADAETDGVKMHYPTMSEGIATISAQLPVKNPDAAQILTNALVANGDNEELTIESVGPEQNIFTYAVRQQRGNYKDAATLTYKIIGECQKGQIAFTVHDISINYKEKGIIPRTLKIEKMNPANNQRHAALIDLSALESSRLIAEIASKAGSQNTEQVSHWKQILAGEIVEGMNMTEVTLAKGKPFSTSGPASKTKWRYEDNTVVIFTNGTVSRII